MLITSLLANGKPNTDSRAPGPSPNLSVVVLLYNIGSYVQTTEHRFHILFNETVLIFHNTINDDSNINSINRSIDISNPNRHGIRDYLDHLPPCRSKNLVNILAETNT